VLAGAISGLIAGLAFAGAHALIITPVWGRMMMGLVFGVVAGAVAGWAFGELQPDIANATLRSGLQYGFVLWLSVVPVTLGDGALRANGFAYSHRGATDALGVVVAILGGALLGVMRGRGRRAVVACAAAALVVTLAVGGPVPLARNVRTVEILFALLLASLVGGAMVGLLQPRLRPPFAPR